LSCEDLENDRVWAQSGHPTSDSAESFGAYGLAPYSLKGPWGHYRGIVKIDAYIITPNQLVVALKRVLFWHQQLAKHGKLRGSVAETVS
jgi:hypothetical protein